VIVLDTNVVSELMRSRPEPKVVRWVDGQRPGSLAVTAITAAELLFGVARMPGGRRRVAIGDAVVGMLREDFAGRILPFDATSAERYAILVADRERAGQRIGMADAQIAAICAARDAPLATRNGKDFVGTGIAVVDPWHPASPLAS